MIIGVPEEVKNYGFRVALTASGAFEPIRHAGGAMAIGAGANVTIMDINIPRLQELDDQGVLCWKVGLIAIGRH